MSKTVVFELKNVDGKFDMPCEHCAQETKHVIAASFEENGDEEVGDYNSVSWTTKSQVVQCLGCESVSFRRTTSHSEDYDIDENGGMSYAVHTQFYPHRAKIRELVDFIALPLGIQDIYQETVQAIDSDLRILAAIGIRAIIETICSDLSVKGRTLEIKIGKLQEMSLVTKDGAKLLNKLREVGNDAAHKVSRLTEEQLHVALKVVNNVLEGTYLIPDQMIRAFTPKERRKP